MFRELRPTFSLSAFHVSASASAYSINQKHENSPSREGTMSRINRRKALKLAGTGALATAGGMAGILATGRSPAFAQQKTVHWLRWVDFVPATDQMFNKELMPAAEKDLGIKIKLETVNGNDLQPRITSGIQS